MATPSSPEHPVSAAFATSPLFQPGISVLEPPVGLTSSVARVNESRPDTSIGPNTRFGKRRTTDQISTRCSSQKRPRTQKRSPKKPPPQTEDEEDEKKPAATESCCICMCDVEPDDLAEINGCEHKFCFGCIEKWAERENSCPLCKIRFSKIDRVNKRRRKGQKNSKKVKQRDQRSDLVPGAALEGLLANFSSRNQNTPSIARLIFSGMGNFTFEGIHGSRFRSSTRSVTFTDEALLESDDEDSPFNSFIRAIQGQVAGRGVMQVVRPLTLSAHVSAASRSYASNINDRSAGNRAENPLEIDDDSDEDDDAVEFVSVRRP